LTSKSRQARVNKQESTSKSRQERVGKQESTSKNRQARIDKQVEKGDEQQKKETRREDNKSKEDGAESTSIGNIHIGGLVSHLLDGPDHRINKVIFPSNGSHHEPRNAESKGGDIPVDIVDT
ncbi:hypothetical protein Tco_0613228, partial [Tanacetum coccineum]